MPGRYVADPMTSDGATVDYGAVVEITNDMLAGLPDSLDWSPLLPPIVRQLCADCHFAAPTSQLEGAVAAATNRSSAPLSEV
jgi:hypothetical protein